MFHEPRTLILPRETRDHRRQQLAAFIESIRRSVEAAGDEGVTLAELRERHRQAGAIETFDIVSPQLRELRAAGVVRTDGVRWFLVSR